MLTVTEEASVYLAKLLAVERTPEDRAFRLCADGESLGLIVDRPRSGDAAFAHRGRIVLVLDTDVVRWLESRTLDVQPSELGRQLAVE